MRRTVIVLIVTTVLLWGSAALGRRSPTTRWDGDPDEYQAKSVHNETDYVTWDIYRSGSGRNKTGRLAPETRASADGAFIPGTLMPGAFVPGQRQAGMIWFHLSEVLKSKARGRLLWEVLFLGKKQRYSGEGR